MDASAALSRDEINFIITSKNIVSRLCKVSNFREKYEVERRKYITLIDKSYEKLDLYKLKMVSGTLAQLMRDYIIRSNDVMIDVLRHHLPRMRDYVRSLPRDKYTEVALHDIQTYEDILRQLENDVNPILRSESEHLDAFAKTLSLESYVHFRELHEKEVALMSRLFHETKVRLKMTYRLAKSVRKAQGKYNEFNEKYPKTVLVLQITLSFGGLICGFFATYKAFALIQKLFDWGEAKQIFNAYWSMEYLNEFLGRLNL